ncbi:cell division protein [Lactobacillus taiwanensis]|uniref:cell division protein n=1 Tax=Lactobacillus taiwanensis TaxID=508451 RepID=UPI001C12A485|nr:cell division protein [Lactobacillus taiwanensis]
MQITKKKYYDYLVPFALGLILATILLIPQFQIHTGVKLSDTQFHFNRFYDVYEQFKNHNFSYFQMNYGFGQTGRVVNAVYGPFFSYILGFLLFITGSWFKFQVLITYIVFIIGSYGMYRLSLKLKTSRITAIVVTLLFLTTGYMSSWTNSNSFSTWGAALVPYVLIQAVNLVDNDKGDFNWIGLGITMAVVAQVHLLSTVICVLALVPFFTYSLCQSKNKAVLCLNLVKAVVVFLVLTANVWGAFLLLYSTNHMAPTYDYPLSSTAITVGVISVWNTILDSILVIFFVQLCYVLTNFKESKLNNLITIEGIVFLFLSSQLFPWTFIETKFPVLKSTFQFPNRLTTIAYPLLFAAIGVTITELSKKYDNKITNLSYLLLVGIILSNLSANYIFTNHRVKENSIGEVTPQEFIDNNISKAPEYLPIQKKLAAGEIQNNGLNDLSPDSNKKFNKKVLSSGSLKLSWQSKKREVIVLPIFMYHQSQLIFNNKRLNPNLTAIGMPFVQSEPGENTAILSFKMPLWFTILLYISLVGWLLIIVLKILDIFLPNFKLNKFNFDQKKVGSKL